MQDHQELVSEAVGLLKRLISTPRVSRQESDAASVVEAFLAGAGLAPIRYGNNVVVRPLEPDAAKPALLLNTHIDTVKVTSEWTRDPFAPTVDGDRLYGIGSNDDGASLVSLIQAYRVLSQRPQAYNLIFAASAEEEVSGKGGMEMLVPLLGRVDVALVGEPTGMQPATAEKGLMVLDVTAHGRSGHAARNEGDNAIYRALDDMQWFRTYELPRVSPLLGAVKMTVTIVGAGTQHNVVPAECTFTVDVRSNECYTNQEIFDIVRQHVGSEVKARSFRLSSSSIDADHPLVRRCLALGRTPFGSPTLSDQALMPWPSMKMGPGMSQRSHTADEFICLSEIDEAIRLYIEVFDGLVIN